ncbi:MAG: hypothetical protein WDO73_29905 [Ignavibacteriota bacterium]
MHLLRLASLLVLAAPAFAQQTTTPTVVTLTFEGLQDTETVGGFYNAGFGGSGSGQGRVTESHSDRTASP